MNLRRLTLRRFFHARPVFVGGFIILALIAFATIKEMRKRHSVDLEIRNLQQEIGTLEQQNMELSKLLDYMKTEGFVEREGREKLGLARAGEKVVVMTSKSSPDSSDSNFNASAPSIYDGTMSNPHKWWLYFFGLRKTFEKE